MIYQQSRSILMTMVLSIMLFAPLPATAETANPSVAELRFLTWENYIDESLVAAFEDQFNAKVKLSYYGNDDTRNDILSKYGVETYDLILVDRVNSHLYQQLQWVVPFNKNKAPNLNLLELPGNIPPSLADTCAPYTWGTTGIAYRKDLVPEPITRWEQIFKPAPELHGKILMSSLSEEVVGIALKSLGYPMYSNSREHLVEARQLLLQQAKAVLAYSETVASTDAEKLVNGEVAVMLAYNSDAMMLKKREPQIEYVLPEEGGAIWVDYVCLSAQAANADLAHQFVNFINEPKNAALNAQFISGATPNREAVKLLPADFLQNPHIYPGPEVLSRCELYQPIPPRTMKKQNDIMNELQKLKTAK